MALVLGIESTCDETAAAVVRDGREVLSNVIATQHELHRKFRGVVPEIASRAHIENIIPVITEAISQARTDLGSIDAISVAHRPGLIGSLLIGVTAAKTLAWALGKPLVAVDHVQAHLYSVMLRAAGEAGATEPEFDGVGLVCSGGHTSIYSIASWQSVTRIGSTIDDAVGEAYDKVAAMLGLGYPGGPVIDRLAASGNPGAFAFPRSMLGRDSLDFSFSGLKTAVKYQILGHPGRQRPIEEVSRVEIADAAASFQAACVEALVMKLDRAVRQSDARSVVIGGGVSANRGLREAVGRLGVPVFVPAADYCTDNAAMIAGLGDVQLTAGQAAGLDLDAVPFSDIPSRKPAGEGA